MANPGRDPNVSRGFREIGLSACSIQTGILRVSPLYSEAQQSLPDRLLIGYIVFFVCLPIHFEWIFYSLVEQNS